MKLAAAFPSESTVTLDYPENMLLSEAERVRVTIRWPTMKEDGEIPDLVFEDTPEPTEKNPNAKASRATKKSLHDFADAILRKQVVKIENLEGVESGSVLAALPMDAAPEVIWATVIAYRAGPNAVIEKKKA